jgi:polyferredoxin
MEKVGLPKGLIRYATEDEIEQEKPFVFSNKMKAYTGVLILLIGFLGFLLYNRGAMEAKFLKPAGSSFVIRGGKIYNTYNYTLLNKTNEKQKVTVKVTEPQHGEISANGTQTIIVNKDEMTKGSVSVSFPENEITRAKQNITIGIYDENGELIDEYETYFEGPFKLQF